MAGAGALVAGIAAVLLVVTLFYIAIRLYDEEQAIRVEDVLLCFFGGLMIPMALSTLVVLKGWSMAATWSSFRCSVHS